MRTYIYIGGLRFNIDSIDAYSHVVTAALNKTPLTPKSRSMTPRQIQELPEEDRDKAHEELRQFALEETAGRFALKPARWAASAEEAATIATALVAETLPGGEPKYSSVIVMPVSGALEHA